MTKTKTQTTVTLNDQDWNTLIATCLLSGSEAGETAGYALATLINVQRKHGTENPIDEYGRPSWQCKTCEFSWDDTVDACPICSLAPDLSYIKDMPQYCGDTDEPLATSDPAVALCEIAWGLIANAYGGDWDQASSEWRAAAKRWRSGWHNLLDTIKPDCDNSWVEEFDIKWCNDHNRPAYVCEEGARYPKPEPTAERSIRQVSDYITISVSVVETGQVSEFRVQSVGDSAYVVSANDWLPINMCNGDALQLTL